ncbi:PDZ domain-containing protein [bacterium]|nr:PDZ domain-containing protein [bacterium]MBU1993658.1 PDZ domain-containing protein [bacterium]
MFRLFLALNLLFLNVYACKGGYDSCKQKLLDSNSIINQTLQLPITKNQRLVFTHITPHAKILKHDPFLSLYLLEDKKGFKYPFTFNNHLSSGYASVNYTIAIEGKIVKKQIGLNNFASFNEALYAPSILTNSCCALEGIVTPAGIIQKEYVQRFLQAKEMDYADIGIRVNDVNSFVQVSNTDPFMRDNPFKKDDCILELNSQKVKDSAAFMMDLLFSKIGTNQKVKIKRGAKVLELNVLSRKRYGGGFVSDTFLEQKGIYFDKDLVIVNYMNEDADYGLKVGDKLLQINGKTVKNQREIMNTMSSFKDSSSLLFERDSFQFFVQIN